MKVITASGSVNTAGDNLIVAIDPKWTMQLFYISFVINPAAASNAVVTVKTGNTAVLTWALNKNGSAFAATPANSGNWIEGNLGDDLIINLNVSETVYYNIFYNILHH